MAWVPIRNKVASKLTPLLESEPKLHRPLLGGGGIKVKVRV